MESEPGVALLDASDIVSETSFDTRDLPPSERIAFWQNLCDLIADFIPAPDADPETFFATIHVSRLNELVLSSATAPAHSYRRDAERIERDKHDSYFVQTFLKGRSWGNYDGVELEYMPGDLGLFDEARPVSGQSEACETVTITLPRRMISPLVKMPDDMHGLVLRDGSPENIILKNWMLSLKHGAPAMKKRAAKGLVDATAILVATCFGPLGEARAASAPAPSRPISLKISRYIDENLTSPDLTADKIARDCGLSRTQFYRLFEPVGGVAAYIWTRRLNRAFIALRNPANAHMSIFEIARSLGFASTSHFSNAFKRTFSITPSQARSMKVAGLDTPITRGAEADPRLKRIWQTLYEL
ncbi:MAG TPA: AraC family transcriptional regulator [Parvibaculum sp.]|jgi:AraC-like DNA-binding protein